MKFIPSVCRAKYNSHGVAEIGPWENRLFRKEARHQCTNTATGVVTIILKDETHIIKVCDKHKKAVTRR